MVILICVVQGKYIEGGNDYCCSFLDWRFVGWLFGSRCCCWGQYWQCWVGGGGGVEAVGVMGWSM